MMAAKTKVVESGNPENVKKNSIKRSNKHYRCNQAVESKSLEKRKKRSIRRYRRPSRCNRVAGCVDRRNITAKSINI